tara:strand:+ start:25 stop:495 length:471 start_codon:yes stop_codon:yes gene_type:complete
MEFVERYVFVDKASSTVYGNHIKINLNGTGGRVPYSLVEVISTIMHDDVEHSGIIVSVEDDAPNFNSSRNKGTVLALVGLDSLQGAKFHYALAGLGTRALLYGSLENTVLTVTNIAGNPLQLGSIDNFSLLFKISYPRPNEITNAFSEQIPLPSRV